jgi:hypothetical protein
MDMKKVKLVFGFLVLGMFALFVYQNLDFLLQRHDIGIDIGLADYHLRNQPIALYFAAVFLVGLLTAFSFALAGKFKLKKNIRYLTGEIEAGKKRVQELEAKLADATGGPDWIGPAVDPHETDRTAAPR